MSDTFSKEVKRNPFGYFVALVLFIVWLYYMSSLSGFSPITNSTIANQLGCSTCGPGGTPAGAYNIVKWFGPIFYLSIPAIALIAYVEMMKEHNRKPLRFPSPSLEFEEEDEE